MAPDLQKWQRSTIRGSLEQYREALANYHVKDKRLVDLSDGSQAFSLLSPPLNSNAARRRVRLIARNITDPGTVVSQDGAATWGSRTPHFLTLAVTYRCQCTCRHCSAVAYQNQVDRDGTALTLTELKDIVRQAIDIGTTCVIFTGGEPLLLDGLDELIGSVAPAQSICIMFTNAAHLDAARARQLKDAGLFGVFVSLDSTDPAQHDANRGRSGLFEKALAGIRHAQDAGLLTGISSYITREKMRDGDLDALMELGRELGVLEVFLFDLIATGRLQERHDCMLTSDEVAIVGELRKRYNESPDHPRVIHQTMFTRIAYPCAAEGCPAGVAQMHVRGNGDVAPCDFTPFAFGNVRERPLRDIWHDITVSDLYSQGSSGCRLAEPAYWDQLSAMASP